MKKANLVLVLALAFPVFASAATTVNLVDTDAPSAAVESVTKATAEDLGVVDSTEVERPFRLGIGTGVVTLVGQATRSWQNEKPAFELKTRYMLTEDAALQATWTRANHRFNVSPSAPTYVTTHFIGLETVFHLGQPRWIPYLQTGVGGAIQSQSAGVNQATVVREPYLSAGLSWELPVNARLSVTPEWKYRWVSARGLNRTVGEAPDSSATMSAHTLSVSLLASF